MRHSIAYSILFFFLINFTAAQPANQVIYLGGGSVDGISDNGKIVVGGFGDLGYYWTFGTGRVELGWCRPYDVTNDTMIVGEFLDPNTLTPEGDTCFVAGYWKNGQWHSIGSLLDEPFHPDWYTDAFGVSSDGSTIVGMQWWDYDRVEAYKWTQTDSFTLLGMNGGQGSKALGVNEDGSIIVGWDENNNFERRAFKWNPDSFYLGSLATPPSEVGEAHDISPNGMYIVGGSADKAFVWTESGGMVELNPGSTKGSYAIDVSDNKVIVGTYESGILHNDGFVYTDQYGFELIDDFFARNNIAYDLDWAYFDYCQAVSRDGKVIAGRGYRSTTEPAYEAWVVYLEDPAALDKPANTVKGYYLEQNYPNPFNPSTTIAFSIPVSAQIRLTVYDLQGREVRTLFNGNLAAGRHEVRWDGQDASGRPAASGLYLYTLQAASFKKTGKMLLVR
ncbi:MAG TPA: T9SS type A sorting domain-containing protein [Caldithrix abyssi]|uniref:T9SS type A sorting domain-containing protein n=1 Tax=Caldithrix abyssi TaxID=187145 RepID=A0A7V4U0K4_CALAY|nr:T9SS type A sorting domain-containing protein [Caldithrix abyssi]